MKLYPEVHRLIMIPNADTGCGPDADPDNENPSR
jgi:hypothetical protein